MDPTVQGPDWRAGPPVPAPLREVLLESQRRGLIGEGALDPHVSHSHGFAEHLPHGADVVDLGSGGGLPGLALAVGRPDLRLTLVDTARRRARFLEWAVAELAVHERVSVIWGRAEDLGRDPGHRERHDAVVARLFGRPGVTAECARPLLASGGALVVSEPPSDAGGGSDHPRWPEEGLAAVGFTDDSVYSVGGAGFRVLRATGSCPDRFPRRPGVAERRPVF